MRQEGKSQLRHFIPILNHVGGGLKIWPTIGHVFVYMIICSSHTSPVNSIVRHTEKKNQFDDSFIYTAILKKLQKTDYITGNSLLWKLMRFCYSQIFF